MSTTNHPKKVSKAGHDLSKGKTKKDRSKAGKILKEHQDNSH